MGGTVGLGLGATIGILEISAKKIGDLFKGLRGFGKALFKYGKFSDVEYRFELIRSIGELAKYAASLSGWATLLLAIVNLFTAGSLTPVIAIFGSIAFFCSIV